MTTGGDGRMPGDQAPRRRAYDDSVPAMQYIEEKLLRAFEEGLRDTRHILRQAIAELAVTVADNALQATKEHADVQGAIAELRADVADLKPLKTTVADLAAHDLVSDGVAGATHDLRRSLWRAAATLAGLIIAVGLGLAGLLH